MITQQEKGTGRDDRYTMSNAEATKLERNKVRCDEVIWWKQTVASERECRCAGDRWGVWCWEKGERGWHVAHFAFSSLLVPPPIFLLVSSSSNFFGVLSSKNSALLAWISVSAAWNLNRGRDEASYSADLNGNFVWYGTSGIRYFIGWLPAPC